MLQNFFCNYTPFVAIKTVFTYLWYTFFLKDKFKNTYINVWKYLINISEKQSLLSKIEILHIDFEIGVIQATKKFFRMSKLKHAVFT
jgi:hypothetical protein